MKFTLIAAALLTCAVWLHGQSSASRVPPQPSFLAPTKKDFPLPGGNLGNQRYSSLTQITASNIGKLGGAWMIHVNDGNPTGVASAGIPIVVDGVMYITAAGGDSRGSAPRRTADSRSPRAKFSPAR